MPKLLLNKTNIDTKAKPGTTNDVLYWDTRTRGFGIRVTPNGVKTFIAQGRIKDTTTDRRVSIGTYGAWTVDDARIEADRYRGMFERGIDPVAMKKQRAAEQVTLRQVMEAYVSIPGKLKPATAAEYRRYVERVLSDWADLPVTAITRDMVLSKHQQIADHGTPGRKFSPGKGAPGSANSAMIVVRKLLNYAIARYRRADGTPLIPENPVRVMSETEHWRKEGDRSNRSIPDDKVGATWLALHDAREAARNAGETAGVELVMMALLTGARKDELAALTWDRVNLDDHKPAANWFHLPNPKNGSEVFLPLSAQASALLRERKGAQGNSPFVFPSLSKSGHIEDPRAAMRIVSKVAGKHLSIHDARRTFTGLALRICQIEKFRVDLLTNHQPPKKDTTIRNYFDCTNLTWLQPDTQKISDWIMAQSAIAACGNVVQLPQRA